MTRGRNPAACGPKASGQSAFRNHTPLIVGEARVLIDGGRIAYSGNEDRAFRADKVIDGRRLTLAPGLTDTHVRVWDEAEAGAYLAHGVTTVRNMSGMPFHLNLAARIARQEIMVARLLTTGPILNRVGPNRKIGHQIVLDAKSAFSAVRWQYEAGFRRIKVYSNLKPDAYDAILSEAARLDMTITGHTPEGYRHAGIPWSGHSTLHSARSSMTGSRRSRMQSRLPGMACAQPGTRPRRGSWPAASHRLAFRSRPRFSLTTISTGSQRKETVSSDGQAPNG